ncbi:MAG: apolipoprotein N-acyltransferase [Acidobacteriota bacterium]
MLLALSFPRYGHPAVAFIALVPLLVALSGWSGRSIALPGVSTRRGFMLGLLAGFIHYAGTVYWTGATVSTFGGIPPFVAVLVAGLLALYMAAYVATFGAITAVLVRRFGAIGLWLAPAAWVTTEYLRGLLIGGFPWIPLGNTMVTLLPIAQLASVVGVYGLSIYVALLNTGVAIAASSNGRRRINAVAVTLSLIVVVSIWGGMRLQANDLTSGSSISVGLIQGNIAQSDKWNPARAGMILSRYMQLSEQAVAKGARFLIWPESSTPFLFEENPSSAVVRNMVSRLGVPLLLGSDEIEHDGDPRSYNSAFMLDTTGATAAVYRKIHLVPFGEYVPFQRLLFFVGPLVDAVSAFSAGTRVTMLPVEGHMVSTAICYEVTYPSLAREAVHEGSELLTTITNDAWYGTSSAPYQHFDMAVMRAIEQGRYLVRSANTGISGIVDPYGRVLIRTNLFETVAVVGEARFVQGKTVYATIGDLAVHVAAAIIVLALAVAFVEGRKQNAN